MFYNGYCIFHTPPGEAENIFCKICGTKCVVEHNIMGPTCIAAAIGHHKVLHDVATCPYFEMNWHDEAYKLLKEFQDTHSKRLKALIKEDLDELLAQNGKIVVRLIEEG